MQIFRKLGFLFREFGEFNRLFSPEQAAARKLVFYSEQTIYYQYFRDTIEYVLGHSDLDVTYVTSDPLDPIFEGANPRVRPFYIDQLLAATLKRLDARSLVMTMPDLDQYHIRRAPPPVEHIYMFHGVGSTHLQYNKHAFDAYDTIFCVGEYDVAELRRAEELYGTPTKRLVECGYSWIENIWRKHEAFGTKGSMPERSTILVAPSWHEENLLEHCFDELVAALAGSEFRVVVRPHPEYIKRNAAKVAAIRTRLEPVENFELELDMTKVTTIHEADLLLTDWSAISIEFAFGTERPVLFVDSPCKVHNPDYEELGIGPIEFKIRDEIGRRIPVAELADLPEIAEDFVTRADDYRRQIRECRDRYLFNWLSSADVAGRYLIDACGSAEEKR